MYIVRAHHGCIALTADSVVRKEYCSIELTESKFKAFVFAIRNHYWYQMYLGKWGLCVNTPSHHISEWYQLMRVDDSECLTQHVHAYTVVPIEIIFLWSDAAATIFFAGHFCAAILRGQPLFPWKSRRHQWRLDKVHTSDTVTTVRRCQWYTQPLSPAVCRWNESYNTKSLSASPVTVVRNYSYTCVCAAYTNRGYYLRASFILLRASNCTTTIWGRCQFIEIQYWYVSDNFYESRLGN